MNTAVYLSGRFTVDAKIEKAWLKRTGCKHRCFSFAFICPEKIPGLVCSARVVSAMQACEAKKVKIMMDSGAYSLHVFARKSSKRGASARAKQKLNIEEIRKKMFAAYCKFCLENKQKWEFYCTLDFKQNQKIIYAMQKRFEKLGLHPTPVYHGDSGVDWLKKHMDMGHKFMCIGGARLHPGKDGLAYYFDQVFNFGAKYGVEFHGLAFTSMDIIMRWPFKSIDSSTWSRVASYGMILLPDVQRRIFYNVHVSERGTSNVNSMHNMTKYQKDGLKRLLAEHDFDLKEMHKGTEAGDRRHDWNGYVMSNLQRFGVEKIPVRMWKNLI